jgi:hypothetical protein
MKILAIVLIGILLMVLASATISSAPVPEPVAEGAAVEEGEWSGGMGLTAVAIATASLCGFLFILIGIPAILMLSKPSDPNKYL